MPCSIRWALGLTSFYMDGLLSFFLCDCRKLYWLDKEMKDSDFKVLSYMYHVNVGSCYSACMWRREIIQNLGDPYRIFFALTMHVIRLTELKVSVIFTTRTCNFVEFSVLLGAIFHRWVDSYGHHAWQWNAFNSPNFPAVLRWPWALGGYGCSVQWRLSDVLRNQSQSYEIKERKTSTHAVTQANQQKVEIIFRINFWIKSFFTSKYVMPETFVEEIISKICQPVVLGARLYTE